VTTLFDFYPLVFEAFCAAMSLLALAVLAQRFLTAAGVTA
jgi:hypothetical protein